MRHPAGRRREAVPDGVDLPLVGHHGLAVLPVCVDRGAADRSAPRQDDCVDEVVVRRLGWRRWWWRRRRWRWWRWRRWWRRWRRWWRWRWRWRRWRRWRAFHDGERAHDVRVRIAVVRRLSRREVHEPRLAPEACDVGHAVRRRHALHTRSLEMEVVQRRGVVDLHRVRARRQGAAVEVVPLRVAERDLASALVLDHADQRPAARRAVVRRRRRGRRNHAIHLPGPGACVHACAGVLAPRVERGHVLAGVRVALRVGNL